MFNLSGLQTKSRKRWQSVADQCRRCLTEQQIASGNPGTILKDFDALLEFVGPAGLITASHNASLPSESLPALNAKVSHPIELALKRALLRDYPNLAGIFILARVMDLLQKKGQRMVVCPEALEVWRSLNVTERYFALLETLVFEAQPGVLGGEDLREDFHPFEVIAVFLDQLSDRWRNFSHYESARYLGPRGELPPWRLFLLEQLGIIEIRPADSSARNRNSWGGRGWLAGGAKLTPWGTAVAWALLRFMEECEKKTEELDNEEEAGLDEEKPGAGPQGGFGLLQPILRPFFPEWQTVYTRPGAEPRLGTHIYKVGLVRWYGGWNDGSIWRRLAVPPDTSLDELAGAILRAFKLDDDHLYDFRYRDQRGKSRVYNHPYGNEGPFTPEIAVGQTDLALKGEMIFTFDYGDDWRFKVRLEQIESGPCQLPRPKVVESEGKAPPQYPPYGG